MKVQQLDTRKFIVELEKEDLAEVVSKDVICEVLDDLLHRHLMQSRYYTPCYVREEGVWESEEEEDWEED